MKKPLTGSDTSAFSALRPSAVGDPAAHLADRRQPRRQARGLQVAAAHHQVDVAGAQGLQHPRQQGLVVLHVGVDHRHERRGAGQRALDHRPGQARRPTRRRQRTRGSRRRSPSPAPRCHRGSRRRRRSPPRRRRQRCVQLFYQPRDIAALVEGRRDHGQLDAGGRARAGRAAGASAGPGSRDSPHRGLHTRHLAPVERASPLIFAVSIARAADKRSSPKRRPRVTAFGAAWEAGDGAGVWHRGRASWRWRRAGLAASTPEFTPTGQFDHAHAPRRGRFPAAEPASGRRSELHRGPGYRGGAVAGRQDAADPDQRLQPVPSGRRQADPGHVARVRVRVRCLGPQRRCSGRPSRCRTPSSASPGRPQASVLRLRRRRRRCLRVRSRRGGDFVRAGRSSSDISPASAWR